MDAAEIRMNDQAKQYEVMERKQKSTQMLCTTLKATMTDQLQQYGQSKVDLNAEITRLQARVDELEYQMLHGGSEAEKQIRAQLMAAMKEKMKEENAAENKAMTERFKKTMTMYVGDNATLIYLTFLFFFSIFGFCFLCFYKTAGGHWWGAPSPLVIGDSALHLHHRALASSRILY